MQSDWNADSCSVLVQNLFAQIKVCAMSYHTNSIVRFVNELAANIAAAIETTF